MTQKTVPFSRRHVLQLGGAALAAPMLASRGFAQQPIVCKIAHTEGIGTPITVAFDNWAKILNERSEGRIDAQHFPAAQLGGLQEALEGNQIGTIQVTTAGTDSEEAVAPELAPLSGVPGFIYKDEAHVDRVLQGDLGRKASEIARQKIGVEYIAFGEVGFRHILAKNPILTMDQLKGVKIRAPQVRAWVDFWSKLGAAPTPLPYSEQYSALSTGIIDAIDTDVFSIEGFKFYEQAKYLTLTGHWFLPKAVRTNAAWLDSLPEDLNQLVHDSAKEVFAEQRKVNRANTGETIELLKTHGVEVATIEPAELQKMKDATAPLFDEYGAKSPETAEMIRAIRALA